MAFSLTCSLRGDSGAAMYGFQAAAEFGEWTLTVGAGGVSEVVVQDERPNALYGSKAPTSIRLHHRGPTKPARGAASDWLEPLEERPELSAGADNRWWIFRQVVRVGPGQYRVVGTVPDEVC